LSALGALLVAEGIFLSGRFEAPDAPLVGSAWWVVVLSQAHVALRFAIALAAAALLLGGEELRRWAKQAKPVTPEARPIWPWLLAHLLAFAAFYRLTAVVVEGDLAASSTPGLWVAIWLSTGIGAVACCAAAVLSGGAVLTFVHRASRVLLVSAAVGAVALLAGSLTGTAWRPLGRMTLHMVAALVSCVATDAFMDAARMEVGTRRFSVEISPGCSGYESIGLIWVFLGVYLWAFRRSLRLPRALLLLPLGAVLMLFLNVLRIAALIAVGTWLSPDIAAGGFHSYAGWLLFCGVALGVVATTRRSSFFAAVPLVGSEGVGSNPTAAYLGPLLALLAVSMLGGAFSSGSGGFENLYPLRVVAVAATLWIFRRQYTGLRWTWSWAAVGVGVAVFVLWMGLEGTPATAGDRALPEGAEQLPSSWLAVWLGFRVLGTVVTVPLAEELAFRGYALRRLIAADFESVSFQRFTALSFFGSSLLFGALHSRLLAGSLAGAAYALVLYRRGEISDAIVAHATTNALLAAWVLATGAWSLWA
jgi:exosortase E/protease (VPEID-CTERM system)